MLWLYLIAALLIAWGIVKDLSRKETWMVGFGKVALGDKPGAYWLTICLRGFILLVVLAAAWYRTSG